MQQVKAWYIYILGVKRLDFIIKFWITRKLLSFSQSGRLESPKSRLLIFTRVKPRVTQSSVFCVMLGKSLFICLSFFFWPLCLIYGFWLSLWCLQSFPLKMAWIYLWNHENNTLIISNHPIRINYWKLFNNKYGKTFYMYVKFILKQI